MHNFIGIEAGGTKFICAIGNEQGDIKERARIPTTTPSETIPLVIEYIRNQQKKSSIDAIGIACFGPLELNKHSPQYGHITATPKTSWKNFDIVGTLKKEFGLPIGFDTDVNASALGEQCWGAAQHVDHFIYVTVGTGIGGGAMIDGKLLHGALHPEMGHILIPRTPDDDFPGVCPYHQDCLEGLASGPSMKERWHVKSALDLSADHKAWDLEAQYLAIACMNFTLLLSPKKIILGGGVMQQTHLFELIREKLKTLLAGYIQHPTVSTEIEDFISPSGLTENPGVCGAVALAEQAYKTTDKIN